MPIFEYTCNECRKRFSALVGVVAGNSTPCCPACGGSKLTKLVSRFAVSKSASLEELAENIDPEDDEAVERMIEGVKDELGDEAGEDFEQMLDES